MFFSKTSVVAGGLVAMASAHIKMSSPQPYAVPAIQNGPLDPSGSNFPCQITAGMTVSAGSASNVFPLGSTQPLTFIGGATHGGGSCQVSLSYDKILTKNSKWKVIHSIQGGCPAKNTPGNIGNDAEAADPFTYSFPIPDNIPTGQATIAWSWLNKIGNREFYMNCAPVTLTGSSGDIANYNSLPDMLVANIAPANGCSTVEGQDYKYPNPGSSVESFADNLQFPVGNCGASGSSDAAAAPAPSKPAAAAGGGGSGGTPTAAGPPAGGVFATVGTIAPSSFASAPAAQAPAPSPASGSSGSSGSGSPPSSPGSGASSSGSGSGSGSGSNSASSGSGSGSSPASSGSGSSGSASVSGAQAAGSPCSPDGQWLCLGSSYQQCGSGTWTPVMSLAAGTSCTAGTGSINIVSSRSQTISKIKARRLAQRAQRAEALRL